MKYTLPLFISCLFVGVLYGQVPPFECISKEAAIALASKQERFVKERLELMDEMWMREQKKQHSQSAFGAPVVHDISVVFHVVTTSGQGITDVQIQSALDDLNASFRNVGYYDPSTGVDTEIQFCLAQRDPDGQPSSGINRINSPLANMVMEEDDVDLKDLSRWDPLCYINFWVVESITSASQGPGVAGYAFFPTSHGSPMDGIVVEAAFTGTGPDRNAVLTHEVGHYFGLYHTFEGGCQNDDCLIDGDKVCDTPPDQSTGYASCSEGMNTCMTDTDSGFATDQPDMISNYMDYSRLECYNRFTSDQKDRMRFFLESIRSSLLECLGCQDPCNEQISTAIIAPGGNLVVCDSLIFTHNSINVAQTEWKVDGSIVSQSGRLALYYDQPGRHEIILIATSASGNCQARDTLNIVVGCAFDLVLNNNLPPCIGANTPINLSINNVPGATISWFIDGNLENNGPDFAKSFLAGAYKVKVIVDDGKCKEEETVTILVGCEEICGNGFDDDNDGLYDCFDPDCCSECEDFYFQACSEDYEDCLPTQPFSMKQKWVSDQDRHNPVFTLVCGDITGDGQVETLSWRYGNEFVFINSNGQTVRRFNVPNGLDVNWVNPAAIADVDGDGLGEIFYISTQDNKVVCLEDDGALKYETVPVQPGNGFGFLQWDPIHIVDLNLDGRPQVVVAFNVFDAVNGDFLVRSPASVQIPFPAGHYVICDILPDNACTDCEGLELVSGSQVVSVSSDLQTMQVETSIPFGQDGNASVVDWDLDGDLDVVGAFGRPGSNIVVWEGQTSTVIRNVNTGSALGAPVVSNLDADPEPELLMVNASDWEIRRYDNNLAVTWRTRINEPTSISPYCFDFHQDGINEVIVRDNSALKIMDGQTGAILDSAVCGSVTNDERPMIADIDGDGHAEIVVSCAGSGNQSIFSELLAFEGDIVEWPKTRPVNFSYSNFLMGINDDLTIPRFAQLHHLPPSIQDLNSSFTQVIIPSEPDTLEYFVDVDSVECAGDQFWITLKICSSGLRSVDSLDISVYNGDPSLGGTERLLTDKLDITMLRSQQCMTIQQWVPRVPGTNYGQFCVIINDDGSRPLPFDYTDGNGFGGPGECDYLNNIQCVTLPPSNVVAPDIKDTVVCNLTNLVIQAPTQLPYRWSDNTMDQDLIVTQSGLYWLEVSDGCGGIDRDSFNVEFYTTPLLMLPDTIRFCENGVITLNAGSGYSEYRWQDGRTDSTYTTFGPGKYWVEVTDTCGNMQRDTSVIIITPLDDLALPDTLNICLGDTVSLEVAPYDQHVWEPNMDISCDDCPRVDVYPTSSRYYYTYVINAQGCTRADSVYISIDSALQQMDTIYACPGDSVFYRGDSVAVGDYQFLGQNPVGCDTLIELSVLSLMDEEVKEVVPVCFGDSLFFRGSWYQPGNYDVRVTGANCDTLYRLMVMERPDIQATIVTTPTCPGDSSGTATVRPMVAGKRLVTNWSGGMEINDSTATGFKPGTYAVIVIDELNCSRRFTFTIDSTSDVNYNVKVTLDSCNGSSGFGVELEGGVIGNLTGNNFNEDGVSFAGLDPGNYQLSLTDSNGCFIKDTSISLIPLSAFNFDVRDTVFIKIGDQVTVDIVGDIGNITSINWTPEVGLQCDTCISLQALPLATTTYTVTILDENGCEHILEITVIVDGSINVYVPNIFSPNGDNINDNFRLFSSIEGLIIEEFEVYSRWGELVYRESMKTSKDLIGWDGRFNGKALNPGVFIYKIAYDLGGRKETVSGSVTLQF